MFVFIILVLFSALALRVSAQSVQERWRFPEAPDHTTTVTMGENVTISWSRNLLDEFQTWCASCNVDQLDLCVQPEFNQNIDYIIGSPFSSNTRR